MSAAPKKSKAKPKDAAAGAADVGVSADPGLPPTIADVNSGYWCEVQKWIEKISSNAILNDLVMSAPHTVVQGGRLAPFVASEFAIARTKADHAMSIHIVNMSAKKITPFYSAGGVLQWVCLTTSPTAGVQINMSDIDRVVKTSFGGGGPSPLLQSIGIGVSQADFDPMAHKGALKVVSPIEFIHGAIKACFNDLCNDASDASVQDWKHFFMSVQIDFYRVPENLMSFLSFHLREQLFEAGETVMWTMLQRVQMVIREKHILESKGGKASASKVASVFLSHVKLATNSDAISVAFVDSSLTIHDRILGNAACQKVLLSLDSEFGLQSPLNSVYKLQALIDRAKTQPAIEFVLSSLMDSLKMGTIETGDFSVKKLKGHIVDLHLLKYRFHTHFLTMFMDTHPFPLAVKEKVRSIFVDHATVRKSLTNYPSGQPIELAWQAALPQSAVFFIQLIESVVYNDVHDLSLKTGAKYNKSTTDILEHEKLKEEIDLVLAMLQKEAEAGIAPSGGQQAIIGGAVGSAGPPTSGESGSPRAAHVGTDAAALKVQEKVAALTEDDRKHWHQAAERLVRQYTRVVVMPQSDKLLVQEIQSSDIGKAGGDMTGLVLIHYDVKLSAEPVTAPRLRIAPFQDKVYEKLVAGVLAGRWSGSVDTTPCLNMGDCVLVLDGGRTGNTKSMRKAWTSGGADDNKDEATDAAMVADDADEDACPTDSAGPKFNFTRVNVFVSEDFDRSCIVHTR
jgi:hypothetical protein